MDTFAVLVQEASSWNAVPRQNCVNHPSSPLMPFDSGLCKDSTGLLAAWLLGTGSVIFSCFGAVYPVLLDCVFGAGLSELAGENLPLQKRTT